MKTLRWNTPRPLIVSLALSTLALLALSAAGQTPSNDMFTNATLLTGNAVTVTGSNVGATREPADSFISGRLYGKTVWWCWTAPANGSVIIDTIGSAFDTVLAVRSTNAPVPLTVADDDSGGLGASKVQFNAVAGAAYYIRVDGYSSVSSYEPAIASGDIVLNLRQAPFLPSIAKQPKDGAAPTGSSVSFLVSASGPAPLFYQWQKDGVELAGATNSYYTITEARTNDAGIYRVVVTGASGSITSSNAVLIVAPVILLAEPQSLTIASGYSAVFSATAAAMAPLNYQWRKDGALISGATDSMYTVTNVQPGDAGAYSVSAGNQLGNATSSNAVLTVISSYTFSTFAGSPLLEGTNDGVGASARLSHPTGLAMDAAGNLYVTEFEHHTVRKITPEGVVTTLAGLAGVSGTNDGPGSGARFYQPQGIVVDSATNVLIGDTLNATIRKITPDGMVSTVAGVPGRPDFRDGTAPQFEDICALTMDAAGSIYASEWYAGRIRKLWPEGIATAFAGWTTSGYADGCGKGAKFYGPAGLALDSAQNLYVLDQVNHLVRKITPGGQVSTLAGQVGISGTQDGTGSSATLALPYACAFDNSDVLYLSDLRDGTFRRITRDGTVTTLAGLPGATGFAEGAGPAARFSIGRHGLVVDALGNIFLADDENQVIRKGVPFAVPTLPQSQGVLAGTPVTLSVGPATGPNGPFTYRWLSNNLALPGETNLTLVLGPVTRSNAGLYSVMVSNAVGNWIQLDATVRALIPPVIQAPEVAASGTVWLRFQDADGGLPFAPSLVQVQWRTNLPTGSDTNWQTLAAGFSLTNGFMVIEDTNTAHSAQRFYRVIGR